MFISVYTAALYGACLACMMRRLKVGLAFAVCLTLARLLTLYPLPYIEALFWGVYALGGLVAFLFLDRWVGVLLWFVSIPAGLHALGVIGLGDRDSAGEVVFALCALIAAMSGPSAPLLKGWRANLAQRSSEGILHSRGTDRH